MRLDKIAFAVVLGLSTVAQAEDNVFVDLSVLDNLNGAYMAPSEPLFPVLPKKEKIVKPAIKKPIKKTKKAKITKAVAPIVELPKVKKVVASEPEVVVVDVEPVSEPVEVPAEIKSEPQSINPVAEAAEQASETPEVENQSKQVAEPVVSEQKAVDTSSSDNSELLQPAPIVAETEIPAEQPIEEPKPELLVDDTVSPAGVSSDGAQFIVFADGVDELNAEQMARIDDIIGRFKDINANKIAIYSYNLDDGVDSFRKKRVSLNRAVGVRSYLIKQGYKNFSIKVININSGSDKINTVELEEI